MTARPPVPHPLNRDGTRRDARFPRELAPESAPVDDRDLAALIEFGYRFAAGVRYFDEHDVRELDGCCAPGANCPPWSAPKDWAKFFDGNATVAAARIARVSPDAVAAAVQEGIDRLAAGPPAEARQRIIDELVGAVVSGLLRVDSWRRWIPETVALGRELRRAIGNTLAPETRAFVDAVAAARPADAASLLEGLSDLHPSWNIDLGSIDPAAAPSLDEDALLRAIEVAAGALQDNLRYLGATARRQLRAILEDEEHAPHLGLYFAFLELFGRHQSQLNQLTDRHLDFYLREVLRLRCAPSEPDRAILTFELAKHVDQHELKAGTTFKGGKDPSDRPLFYAVQDTTILNRAKVADLKAVRREAVDGAVRVLAGQKADSSDGRGKELDPDRPWWKPFGRGDYPAASIGFAVASPVLRQVGGTKRITLTLTVEGTPGGLTSSVLDGGISVFFTSSGSWEPAGVAATASPDSITLVVTVPPDQAIVDHDADAHGTEYPDGLPILRAEIDQTSQPTIYGALEGLVVTSVRLDFEVTGDRLLTLHNDVGAQDPAKPVSPFGTSAEAGARFFIGSQSVFQKKIDTLGLNLQWAGLPEDLGAHYSGYGESVQAASFTVEATVLEGGRWRALRAAPKQLFAGDGSSSHRLAFTADDLEPKEGESIVADPEMAKADAPAAGVARGFLRLELTSPSFGFGSSIYPGLYTKWAINYAVEANKGSTSLPVEPNAPYTPVLASISLDYTSSVELDLKSAQPDRRELGFRHVGPFGNWVPGPQPTLVPSYPDEGALYIGLDDLSPQQSVSLLFQLVEGTENPFAEREDLDWSYLADTGWEALPDRALVRDGTDGLRRSGVVVVTLPEAAVVGGRRIPGARTPDDRHWFRITMPSASSAVPDLAAVVAQAADVVFEDRKNDLRHLGAPKEAGTIAKPERKDAALKTVAQPFSSRAGRGPERARDFYLRSSERLRHKDRASTLWDYERLVLNRFPTLHRVKCINHADEWCELAPGSVLVVTIPDTIGHNAVDRFRPAVTQAVRAEVEEFLKGRIAPGVRLLVRNPLYEEIFVEVSVVLDPAYDPQFYKLELETGIQRFLAPWAFGDADITFEGSVHRSEILNFIEEREYVDYITSFRVEHRVEGEIVPALEGELRPTTARSILVPAAQQVVHVVERSATGGGAA